MIKANVTAPPSTLELIFSGGIDIREEPGKLVADGKVVHTCKFQVTPDGKVFARPGLPTEVVCTKHAKVILYAGQTALVIYTMYGMENLKIPENSKVTFMFDPLEPILEGE